MSWEKPVRQADVNYDHDESIFAHTIVKDGKWLFYNPADPDDLIADAQAPSAEQMASGKREIMTAWADGVRAKVKGRRELTTEQIENAEARKKAQKSGETKSEGGIIIPEGAVTTENLPEDMGGTIEMVEETSTVSDDPDAFLQQKIDSSDKKVKMLKIKEMELQEEMADLKEQLSAALKDKAKWEKMKESIDVD